MSRSSNPSRRRPQPAHEMDIAGTETVHHEPSSKKRRQTHQIRELNLTSMLDVTFQLLIFFMLTASFTINEGILPADLPAGQSPSSEQDPEPPQQPINIMLRSLGGEDVSIQVEGFATPPADFGELYNLLAQNQHRPNQPTAPFNADDPVVIRPDQSVPWGAIVGSFNAAVRARYTNVNFAQPQ